MKIGAKAHATDTRSKNTKRMVMLFFIIMPLVSLSASFFAGCGNKPASGKTGEHAQYYCPMHPSYTSDRPGDCPICNMKLVKKEQIKQNIPLQNKPDPALAQEKAVEEVCVEHQCTMKNCPMSVRAQLKPGERIICPVCGDFITTASGKVVEVKGEQGRAAASSGASRKILFYRNPMNPEITSPVPAKDQMGMDYVPVYESQTSEQGVSISPERQQLIGVKTEIVQKRDLKKTIRAAGKIAYDPELAVAQEEFVQALNSLEGVKDSPLADVIERAQSFAEASRSKLKLLGMSDEQISELQAQKKVQTNLYLPAKGENVWAYLSVYEYEIGMVNVGAPVSIEAVAYPGEVFQGAVSSINPVLDATTRTNQVRAEVINTGDKLKPEMFVNATINIDLGEKLAVPESAILDTGLRKIVYLVKGSNLLEAREVKLGQKAEGYYEVVDGLQEGDMVVTSGNFLVDSESRLQQPSQASEQNHEQ